MRCKGPIQRLVMFRARNLLGPVYQRISQSTCLANAGNYLGSIGSGPRARSALLLDNTSIQVTFTKCVSISATTGFEYQIGTGAWTAVSAVAEVTPPGDGTTWDFTVGTIPELTQVRWRMAEGAAVDCDEGEDVPAATLLAGNVILADGLILLEDLDGYVLTEDGDYILLES
jgi:hypothetical protein